MLTINQEIGRRLQQARESKGLSIIQVASQIGVTIDEWKRWETGQADIPFDLGVSAARLLGIAPEWLAYGDAA